MWLHPLPRGPRAGGQPWTLKLEDYVYHPAEAEEHFLHFRTPEGQIAGYLRLSLPSRTLNQEIDAKSAVFILHPETALPDLEDAAIIREIHVYGQSLPVGGEQPGAAQHVGLGTSLIHAAEEIALQRGFSRLAVIAAVGTRSYYLARGFERGELYLAKTLASEG